MAGLTNLEVNVSDKFHYVYSCDVDSYVELKIGTLEGKRERKTYKELLDDPQLRLSGLYQKACPDLYVTCEVFADGKALYTPIRTSHKAFSTRWNWNEWLKLPIKYQDLPRNAQVALTVWDVYNSKKPIPVGGTTVSLFGKKGMLRQGIDDLRVWPGVEADGSEQTKTPGKQGSSSDDIMDKLAKLSKRHHKGRILKVDWLDRLTFREIEMVNEKEKRNSNFMYLMVEFPRICMNGIEYSMVYFEKDADRIEYVKVYPEIVTVPDPEVLQENLVESKHHKLTRSVRSGTMSRDLKPNAAIRDQLNKIVGYPPTTILTEKEKDLVWQFRFYLTSQKKALTKFLKCINWNQPQEAKQAIELLNKWEPIDTVDALELLTPQFTNRAVRQYAVSRLKQASNEDLLLYLLQLVQALRYEVTVSTTQQTTEKENTEREKEKDAEEISDLIDETKDLPSGDDSTDGENEDKQKIDETETETKINRKQSLEPENSGSDLASFLVSRACTDDKIANFFFWYLLVECKDVSSRDKKVTELYVNVTKSFSKALLTGDYKCKQRRILLGHEQLFLDKITDLMKAVEQFGGNRKKKIEKLQSLVDVPEFVNFKPIPLPLDPEVKIKGIVPEKVSLFKSALMPMKLTFRTVHNKEYVAIFKNGDDLRQDQLILQIIRLMDKLLMRENLDLKLTPYNVLATGSSQGFVQYVHSTPVAEILSADGSIQNFFRKHNPLEGAPYGIHPDCMDTYIKSCAGYCVVTYILGVGDRHLDNLMLTKSGNLFHIDFGYILGRDPKPLPPPMKLSKEMVEAMGGTAGEHYPEFRRLCFTAFLHLRRYANLILNLFALMVDANVPDIALEPDKTVKKVQDKFRLDLSDEEAVQFLQALIDESVSAVFASVVEQIHKWAQYWRR